MTCEPPFAGRFAFGLNDAVLAYCTHYRGAALVFEQHGMAPGNDSGVSLADHCQHFGQEPETIRFDLARRLRWLPATDDDSYTDYLLTELVDDILTNHHAFLDAELGRLQVLVDACFDEDADFVRRFGAFRRHMLQHMAEEEAELFPLARRDCAALLDTADAITRHIESGHEQLAEAVFDLARRAEGLRWSDPAISLLVCDGLGLIRRDLDLHGRKEDEYLIPAILHRIETGQRRLIETGWYRRQGVIGPIDDH